MLDSSRIQAPMQRVSGRACASFVAPGRIKQLSQSGSAKVLLPKMHGRPPEVVFLNTAGGITGGDHLSYALEAEAGAVVTGTTQTAERAYRSTGPFGEVETRLCLGEGATLHWLPQELILFDGCALDRRLSVDMPSTARALILETLVFGRAAMGERLQNIRLRDRRHVVRDGRTVMVEALELSADDLVDEGVAGLDGAIALATLSFFAPEAEDWLARLRGVLPSDGPVRAAASAWDGRLVARFMASEAYPLRKAVARAVSLLVQGPVPRVWQL